MGVMTYEEWLDSIPPEFTDDPLWRMEVYRLAVFSSDLAWQDVSKMMKDRRTIKIADQLYRAVGSIGANISEGYSRRSDRDQARLYEYALGSAREARGWYRQGRHVLSEDVATHRIRLLTQIIRLLMRIIPARRGSKLREGEPSYAVDAGDLLSNPPIPT